MPVLPVRLGVARELAGLTLLQASRLTRVSAGVLASAEAGGRELDASELDAVAEAYDVRPGWLRGHSVSDPDAERALAHWPEEERARVLVVLDSMRRAD